MKFQILLSQCNLCEKNVQNLILVKIEIDINNYINIEIYHLLVHFC